MYDDLITGISLHPSLTLALLAFFVAVAFLLFVLESYDHRVIKRLENLHELQLQENVELARNRDTMLDQLHTEYLGKVTAARRELIGYRDAVQHLTAHPTTVVVHPDANTYNGVREAALRDVRESARNFEPLPE